MQTLVDLITKKRDGGRLSDEDIERVIVALETGEFAEYQMSALLMAIFFRGMDGAETVDEAGERIFQLMLATASGQATKSELHGYGQNEFVPWQLGAVM